jgi:hypothetical protein
VADSQEELQREFEEFEQAESSLDSGLESAPRRQTGAGVPPWIKWVLLADLVIVVAVVLVVLAA